MNMNLEHGQFNIYSKIAFQKMVIGTLADVSLPLHVTLHIKRFYINHLTTETVQLYLHENVIIYYSLESLNRMLRVAFLKNFLSLIFYGHN